jgi:hypothetical protein
MINTQHAVIAISLVLLSAAPWISAQDVKPTEARLIIQRRTSIQELPLQPRRILGVSLRPDLAATPSIITPDLSKYRGFQFGMNLPAVAKQAGMEPADARVLHQRPMVIQELQWRPKGSFTSLPQADPVKEVLFSFCDGELFRMVVNYDRYRTEGLTDEDMVDAISARYGTAIRPDAKVILFSSFQVYNDTEKVIARWENSQYSFNLFRSSFQPTFGMLIFDKRLDALAQAAIAEAIRLDEQEAPQREIQRQQREDDNNRESLEKARQVNKRNFRY